MLRRQKTDKIITIQKGKSSVGENIVIPLKTLLALIMFSVLAGCTDSSEDDAFELANNFYQTHQTSHPSGALSLNELITFRRYLSTPLFNILKDVSVAEETHQAQNDEDSPALVEGDLFTANPKGATSYRLLTCQVDEDHANCSTEVIYNDAKQPTPYKSIDRLALIRENGHWVIDNIVYGSAANSGMRQGDLHTYLQSILGNNARKAALAVKQ